MIEAPEFDWMWPIDCDQLVKRLDNLIYSVNSTGDDMIHCSAAVQTVKSLEKTCPMHPQHPIYQESFYSWHDYSLWNCFHCATETCPSNRNYIGDYMGMFYISVARFFCIHASRPALSTRVHHKTTQKSFEINHLTAKKIQFYGNYDLHKYLKSLPQTGKKSKRLQKKTRGIP